MKKLLFMAALFCLLASASPVSAQLIIRNSGHAEIGINPNENDTDSTTVLKIFGNKDALGSGGRITFCDGTHVRIGELGDYNSNKLMLHGKDGVYFSATPGNQNLTIGYYDTTVSDDFNFNCDVTTSGLFVQSDERFKENIEPVSGTLKALEGLEAVTYDLKRQHASLKNDNGRYGFLAQNVKDVFPELVHSDKSGYMYVDYIGLIPILVQSINELRAELAEVKAQKQEAAVLASQATGQSEIEASLNAAKLYQNAPNPWSSETVIRYNLPQSVGSATIYVYDMQGAQLKSIPATGRGESQVTLTARDLKAGMYLYALVADGQLIDSKQMILTK